MIGFLGGTGPEGRSLALRLALAGENVAIGSRNAERAKEIAKTIEERGKAIRVVGGENSVIINMSDIVFITVPYAGQATLLESLEPFLRGKLIVDTVAPVSFDGGKIKSLDINEGSAAEEAQRLLPNSKVVAAFQNVSAVDLWVPDRIIQGDVIVCSDYDDAKEEVISLAQRIPNIRGVDGGDLANSKYVEEFTAMLLNINRIYKVHSMVRIVGLPE
jgi:hypothetical protein